MFVLILRKLLQFFVAVSPVIRRSCSHFPCVSIIESSWALIGEQDRAGQWPTLRGPGFFFSSRVPFWGLALQ